MNVLELSVLECTKHFEAKFKQTAENENGRAALDWASDCVDDWAGLAAEEFQRRMVMEIFANLSKQELMVMMTGGMGKIDFKQVVLKALDKV